MTARQAGEALCVAGQHIVCSTFFVRSKALPLCSLWQVEQASLLSSWSGTSRAQDATVKTNGTPIADGSTLSAVSDVSAAVSIPCGLNEFAPRSWQAMQSLLSDSLAECENAAIGQATIPFSNAVWQPLQSATSLCWNVTLPGLSRRGARGPPTTRSKKPMDIATTQFRVARTRARQLRTGRQR